MLRWTVSLAVLAAMLVSSTELMAQRRQPLRNIARQIGVRWSAGYHWQNPGHDSSYYSPWSEVNTPSYGADGSIIQPAQAPAQNAQPTPPSENSASYLLNRSGQQGINRYQTADQGRHGNSATISDNEIINRHLQPFHRPPAEDPIKINQGGGNFKATPSQIPANNTGWEFALSKRI